MAIDIGEAAITRGTNLGTVTIICKGNPANASGEITSVEIYAFEELINTVVGTFYVLSGDTLKCRDSEAIGTVAVGAKRTIPVTVAVELGDYIGIWFTGGWIYKDDAGGGGLWRLSGEHIDPGDEGTYSFFAGQVISLYGTGEEVVGWSGKVKGVTDPAEVIGVDKANIAKVIGVA